MATSSRSVAWRAGRWRLHPIWRSTRQTWPGWYLTPVTASITSATRASVHSSVGYPLAVGPLRSAFSTLARSDSVTFGSRPARPAARSAFLPPAFHLSCQSETVWCTTPSSLAISAWETPLAKRSAAFMRRSSMAAKSRRGRALGATDFAALFVTGVRVEVGMAHCPTLTDVSWVLHGYYTKSFSSSQPEPPQKLPERLRSCFRFDACDCYHFSHRRGSTGYVPGE